MLLEITHETELSYSSLINESVMEIRMAPRQEHDQHRLSFRLAIGPSASVTRYFDWLGNMVHTFNVTPFHDAVRIVATSVVETMRTPGDPMQFADCWPVNVGETDYAILDFVQFGGPVVDSPELRALVASIQPVAGERLGALALRIMQAIADGFEYRKGVTTAASPITEVLEKRSGVCQDFTHLMIGVARALHIPARYVSGCLHPVTEKASRGFTETHAWCELYFPSHGWVGFDPANNCLTGENFVKLAVGRNFADVPPNKGVFRGNAEQSILVRVKSEELLEMPVGLAPERFESLGIKTREAPRLIHVDQIAQQQEQQQQEHHQQEQQQQQ